MSPLKQSKNLAARMGRWSASHWKTATFGWLAFVIASFAMGIAVPMKMIDKNDAAIGEAGKANKILDEAFDLDETGLGELVIIQSKTKTVDDPAFRATINETVDVLSSFEEIELLHSPFAAGNEGQISPDRHAVMITFSPQGTYRKRFSTSTRSSVQRRNSRRRTPTTTSARRESRPRRRSTRPSTVESRRPG